MTSIPKAPSSDRSLLSPAGTMGGGTSTNQLLTDTNIPASSSDRISEASTLSGNPLRGSSPSQSSRQQSSRRESSASLMDFAPASYEGEGGKKKWGDSVRGMFRRSSTATRGRMGERREGSDGRPRTAI
ncbi:hypothetical protein GQ43DRAFT_441842 [Delitschia confertaspora ATCC 74209]|uniref:Uncharacterized protein n=1 Tax=Delitschia confertaspora ATCC 74209 TaxID=1513339 RepID=A0A9P4JJB4_9PLEO|nr:hypothetical protein GQ43DRAFT_441842 [Delitschia confertaspora ATCC 74209]